MGVHLRVLGGLPVWPMAFHRFVTARDRRAFVEQRLECPDFLPIPFRLGSVGARLLEDILVGYHDEWGTAWVPAAEVNCVLVALGLLHLRVKCVIPEELGGSVRRPVGACLWLGWRVPGTFVVTRVRSTREREGQLFVAVLHNFVI